MIAVDTNILVYAHRKDAPFHRPAHEAMERVATGRGAWTIPWACVHEFFGVVTNPRVFKTPTPAARALDQINAWLESPVFVPIVEGEEYLASLRRVIAGGGVVGSRVHDARIYALCLASGVSELWSADRDFSKFSGLRVKNPIE